MPRLSQLSGLDAAFLYLDTDRASTGATMIYIYDQSSVPAGKLRFKQILQHIESRIDVSPIFKHKVKQVPFALDYPYWVTDKNFHIEHHVSHLALPKPGDWRQFCILASRLTRPHFDMNRPLWEMYVVEGLDNIHWLPKDCFAILTRIHHALVDGGAAAELTWALHDNASEESKLPQHQPVDQFRQPSTIEMIGRALRNNISSPVRLARPLARVLPAFGRSLLRCTGDAINPNFEHDQSAGPPPTTRFNRPVSAQRVFGTSRMALDALRTLRTAVPGSTINDVILTIIGGALRLYLDHHGELPTSSLVSLMPVNTREGRAKSSENQITLLTSAIGTHIDDPADRLRAVYASTSKSKTMLQGIGARELTDINKHVPAALLAAAGKFISYVGVDSTGTGRRLFNIAISNVPGPTQPLFLQGAKLRYWSVVGPILDGAGIIFACSSYDGEVFISPTACRDMVPDPDFLIECIDASLAQLQNAARPLIKTEKRRAKAAENDGIRPKRDD